MEFWSGELGLTRAIGLGAALNRIGFPSPARVNPLSPNHRFVIALLSPIGVFETGLPRRSSEKRATKQAHGAEWDILSSPVQGENPQNCADFSRFSGKYGEVSLRSRLCGGEEGFEPSAQVRLAAVVALGGRSRLTLVRAQSW